MKSPVFALKRAYQAARNALEARLLAYGITVAQLDVLKLFCRPSESQSSVRELDQRSIQKDLGITSATLTRLLAGMERRQLVERAQSSKDTRSKKVRATAKARKLFAKLMVKEEQAFDARFTSGLSADEIETLIRLLDKVAGNMTK